MSIHDANLICAEPAMRGKQNVAGSFWPFAALLCILAMLCPLGLQAQTNFVYVNNQSGVSNTISIFSVDTGGVATSIGNVNTGGTGATVACAGIDRITTNLASNLLFVSNSGDQTVSVFRIAPGTGALTAVAGSPFATGLTLDSCAGISLAATPDGHFLMASSNGTIKTFSVAVNGSLSPSATATLLPTPMVGMKISGDGRFLAVSHQASVSVFTISGVDGSLTAVTGSPFAKGGTGLVGGLDFNCDGTLLYAAEGGTTSSITDAWTVAPSGALTPILGSPFSAAGNDSNVVFLTPDNTILYQSNQGSQDLNSFTVNPDGSLTSIGLANIATGHTPAGMGSDNSGLFLYSADDAFGLAVFNILPGVVPTLVGDTAIAGAGQIQSVAAYPPRSCAHTDLSVTQTASPNPVTAGNQITYNITITNNGPSTASVAINDLLPKASMTFVSCTAGPGGVCDKGAGLNRTITFASMASGQSGTVTLVGSTLSTLLNGDTISNTAASSNSSAVDTNPVNNSATTVVSVSAPQSATNFIVANSTGTYFGTTTLSTTLHRTSNGTAVVGRTITFSVNGLVVGTAVTNATGVATLPNVSLVQNSIPINAGTYVGALSVSFAGDNQFGASSGTSTLTVTKATLTVTTQPATRVYGDANPPFTFVISGFLNNETTAVVTGTANCTSSAGVNTPAGTQTITCSIGTLAATNYIFTFVNGVLTITKAPLVLTGTNVSRLYGDPNPAITGTVVGLKAGDQATATFSSTAVSTSPVGTYPITGVLVPVGGFNVNNYTVTSSGNVTVTPAPLTAAATNVSRAYGDANPAFTGTVTGLKNGDAITGIFSSTADATSPVGTYPITATFSDPGNKLGNYTVVATGVLTVVPASLSATAPDASRLYGDPNPALTGTLVGLKNGDIITATFSSPAVAGSPVGAYPIVASLVDPNNKAGNYTFTSTSGTLTVTPAPLAVAADNFSRGYGDANPAFNGTLTGIKNADNITATFTTTATPASSVGTFSIVPVLVDPTSKLGNYTVLSTNGTLTVDPAPLSVSATSTSRIYGDANPVFAGTITGIKNSDNITATFASTAVAGSPVGAFPIVPTLVDLTSKLGNYTVTSTNGTLTVAPAQLTVTGANASRIYGDANPAFIGSITGIKNADNITATFASVALVTSPVGTFAIVPTLADPTAKLGNYTVISNNGTLTIGAAPLTVTATDATRIYGDANPAFAGTVTGLKNGDAITATFASVATPASNAGTFAIVPTLVDPTSKLGNYAVTSSNGTLTITQAALTVTAGNASRIYGDPNPAFTGTIVGLKNGDNITATVSGADALSAVGTYPLVPVLVDPTGKLANYTVSSTNGALTITPAALIVTAANASRAYGDPNPTLAGTITGIKNADNITATFASVAVVTSPVGAFTIVPTLVDPTAKLANYTVTSNNGSLTVSPAPLTVAGANANRLYGDPNPSFTGTITGIKNADNITATFASAATVTSPAETSPIVPTLVDPTAKLSNYAVTSLNGTLTINPAPLTVTGTNASRVYGDPNPSFTGTITGIRNADNITATFISPATAGSPVGTFSIVPTLVDPTAKAGNYAVTSNNGVLTITAAPLTISAGSATRVYGDPNPAFAGTIVGLKNNDNITATVSGAGAAPTSPVGSYVLVPALVDPTGKAGNYAVTLNNGTLTITPAALSISANNATRLYGDANPAFTATFAGLRNADNITASFTTAATPASAVGAFAIIPAPVDPTSKLGNYTVTLNNGTLTVSQAPLSVTATSASRLYGDPNPVFTGTLSGVKLADDITASFSSAAVIGSSAGSYPIVGTLADPGAKLGNYAVTSNNGTLIVSPAALSVSAADATRLYGDPNPAFTGAINGLKNGDVITLTFSSASPASPIGTYAIVASLVDPGLKAGNYNVSKTNGTLTVTVAALSVTAANVTRAYGDPNPLLNGSIVGIKNGDSISATFSTTAVPASLIGTYPVIPALVDPTAKLGNYSVTAVNGVLTVGQATPVVTVSAVAGQPTTLLQVRVQNAGAILPTGTVQFFDGATALGSPVAIASPTPGAAPEASIQAALAAGNHAISVAYIGDSTYKAVTTSAVNVTVGPAPAFGLVAGTGGTSATIQAGQNATFNIALNPQGFTGTIVFACSGAPAGATCSVSPGSVHVNAASSNVPITVTVSGTQSAGLPHSGYGTLFAFAGVFAGVLFGLRRKRKQVVFMLLAIGLIAGLSACGGGSGPGTPTVRPPTNAVITVTGTSGTQSASINLNLTINH
ncbi:MAG: DUF11 domain-containing protein [Acidobacteriia bacterium]|nr:DUF11 domain-containing protein [Terriglobia bacterium]